LSCPCLALAASPPPSFPSLLVTLQLDYGLPPEHPVNRGAAPDPDARGVIKTIKRQKWTEFGLTRKRANAGVIGRLRA
jgi:hypothetical protein